MIIAHRLHSGPNAVLFVLLQKQGLWSHSMRPFGEPRRISGDQIVWNDFCIGQTAEVKQR